ncbi:NAD(P)-dependent oxidoreductase [Tessaracoccus oleiagri]|uniref:2-hydroxy-3-oxopropionate reductase n=1 Tax=Tessaracoccus oleiagri TaxID=686624 RepID=A0A1G9I4Y0_9ACTN|nr:NAD(P)-dependent oxidoreductase [Tessaracoccus oleiagri]SDL20126.1 2-hydroxy-3-oxopropionate reductase [Tessaracoccus oleiagri]
MTQHTVGLIGTGAMGIPMALRLLAAGKKVVVYSRSIKPALVDGGAAYVDTPRELAAQAHEVLVMLPDLPQLEPLLIGDESLVAAARPLLVMVGSTSSAVRLRELAHSVRRASEGRVELVDTPVSGGVEGADAGTLSIMVGADAEQFQRVAKALSPCGTVHHLGPLGAGEVAKACNQMVVSATMLALGEATVLAERSGIEPFKLMEVLSGGYAGSKLLEAKKRKLIEADYSPGGIAAYMVKDLGFARDIAEATSTAAILLPALQNAYEELVSAGLGEEDLAVVRRFVAERV